MHSPKFAFAGIGRVLDAISSCVDTMKIPKHEYKLLTINCLDNTGDVMAIIDAGDNTVALTGADMFSYLISNRFNYTVEQALNVMRKTSQDMSWYDDDFTKEQKQYIMSDSFAKEWAEHSQPID